jgi:predicted DNA-binding transcriptional regulator YafY
VLKGGIWYLVAQSGKSVRSYRAANILDAQIADEMFARPAKFDLAGYWQKSSRDYEAGVYREQAEVRLSQDGFARLNLLGPYVMEAAAKTARKPDRQGWVRCTVPIESIDYGVRELMRLGEDVEVLGPPALRARMAAKLEATSKRYRA